MTEFIQEFRELIGVLIGGFLATIGGVIGTYQAFRLKQRDLKRDKLEMLLRKAYELDAWLIKKIDTDLLDREMALGSSPYYEILVLSGYFGSELRDEISKIKNAYLAHEQWIIDGKKGKRELIPDGSSSAKVRSITENVRAHSEKYALIYKDLIESIDGLNKKIAALLKLD